MKDTRNLVVWAVLTAIIVLMGFTPLGYLKLGVIEITLITIPVIVGACTTGKIGGLILGGVFGLTSFIQCFGMSAFGSMLLSINPVFAGIVCIVPRMIMGFLCGLIFEKVKGKGRFLVASISAPLLNTILFTGGLLLFYGNSEYVQGMISESGGTVLKFLVAFIGINGIVEAVVCAVAGTAITAAVYKVYSKKRNGR